MHRLHPATLLLALAAAAGCSAARTAPQSDGQPAPSPPAETPLPAAPWRQPPLASADVPGVYLAQWRAAANRGTCAPLAPASLGAQASAQPRAATFSGGWAVAYDLPGRRSAFGVAGTGSRASDPSYSAWPHHLRWADGSTAGYGPEGGTGTKQLAYLRIAGQDCLYNVWSELGREHLEQLLSRLRFVSVAQ
jgi:hypothetical protein